MKDGTGTENQRSSRPISECLRIKVPDVDLHRTRPPLLRYFRVISQFPIILDNSITGMTGHQQNPTTGKNLRGEPAGKVDLEALCKALGFNRVRVVDPYDLKAVEEAVTEELADKEPSIIISRRPCVMIKGTVHKPPISVDEDKCVGCKQCMSIGCPAIAVKDKKAHIDPTLCIGCKVCSQMCKFGAI